MRNSGLEQLEQRKSVTEHLEGGDAGVKITRME